VQVEEKKTEMKGNVIEEKKDNGKRTSPVELFDGIDENTSSNLYDALLKIIDGNLLYKEDNEKINVALKDHRYRKYILACLDTFLKDNGKILLTNTQFDQLSKLIREIFYEGLVARDFECTQSVVKVSRCYISDESKVKLVTTLKGLLAVQKLEFWEEFIEHKIGKPGKKGNKVNLALKSLFDLFIDFFKSKEDAINACEELTSKYELSEDSSLNMRIAINDYFQYMNE